MPFESVINWLQSLSIISWTLWSLVIGELLRRLCGKIYYHYIYHQPQGPAGLPIIGSLISIFKSPETFFLDSAAKYGPIMSINMGLQRNIFINDKKLYKKLCAENKNISVDKPHFNYLDVIFKEPSIDIVNGRQWVLRRKLLSSSFLTLVNSKFVSNTVDFSINNISDKLDSKSEDIWYPRKDLKYIVFNVAFKALFGSELQNDDKLLSRFFDLNKLFTTDFMPFLVFDMFKINFFPNWLVKKLLLGPLTKAMKDLFDLIETWMVTDGGFQIDKQNEIIQRVTKTNDDTRYYIDTVIDYLKEHKDNKEISYYALIFDFNSILMAAADTTVHSIEYGLCLLCKHDDIQQIIYNEIENVLQKHKMDKFDIGVINECVHLRAFVYETLRISNVVPVNPHFNDKDINLKYNGNAYFIPKNTSIFINAQFIHYNIGCGASFELNLNNWISNNKFKLNPDFILFGVGKRNCVGQTLAMRELYYILATLVLKYKLEVKDKKEMSNLNEMKQAWNVVTILDPQIGINLTKRK